MKNKIKKEKPIKVKKTGLDLLPELNDEIVEKYLLVKKIQNAVLDMMSKVKIDGSHNYTRISDGKWLAGVTSVSGLVPKEWLSAWGAKECAKFLGYSDYEGDIEKAKEMMQKIADLKTPEEFITLLKEAKGASFRKSKEALVDGKTGHDWIENWVKAKIRGRELPIIPEGNLERPLKQFVEWHEKEILLPILSEARVADVDREYAGTMDELGITRIDGKLALLDYKFASHISDEYALQLAGYQACFEKYDIRIDKRIIIRLPKTLTREEWDEKEHKYKIIENTIEVKEIETPYEFDRNTFYSALPVKKWVNYVENKGRNNK